MTSRNTNQSHELLGNPHTREIAILMNSIENVFRKLIRLLIGRISLKKLQELIQIIFIEESEAKLIREAPGKNPTLVDVALLTGVDTRTIKKIKERIELSHPSHKDTEFLNDFMPMFKLFDLWMNDGRFFDAKLGKPKKLEIDGKEATFSQLVKLTLPSRGLSAQLVLKRLQQIGVVSVNPSDGTVKLIQEDNIFISKSDFDSLEVGFAAIGNLVDTVSHNIQNPLNSDAKFFQRGCWNYQFSPKKINQVRRIINDYLKETDKKSRELITSLAEPERQNGQITAGISMFYFENRP